MRIPKLHLEALAAIKKERYHPLLHRIHKKHNISRKTLFYIKEYGPHRHAARVIIKESIGILLLASIISSLGGLALENIKTLFISITPFIILLPVLNDMIGDYGTIISSKFSAMLHEGKIKGNWKLNTELRNLFGQVLVISFITTIISFIISLAISGFSDYALTAAVALKVLLTVMIDVALLLGIIFLISVAAGLYFFRKQEDPNNFLIPIITSVADFGNTIVLSILIVLLF